MKVDLNYLDPGNVHLNNLNAPVLNVLNSWNPLGHPKPVTGLLYLYLLHFNKLCEHSE